jgi:cytosine permease
MAVEKILKPEVSFVQLVVRKSAKPIVLRSCSSPPQVAAQPGTSFSDSIYDPLMPTLPPYLAKTAPNPISNRAPWYVNTAPSYAGVFLWVAFYQSIAQGTIDRAGIGICLLGLVVAGLLGFAFYYYAPAMLGMKTGLPLYVIGSSTFGTTGGYLMPGLLMGLLQIGWFAVATFLTTTFILSGLKMNASPGTIPFVVISIIWGYVMGYIGVKGIQYVAKVSLFLNVIPLLMILFVFARTFPGISHHTVAHPDPFAAFTGLIAVVIGFFATAGAAGADFGMNNRNQRDVKWGGLVGITVPVLIAGGLPLLSVAGARALDPHLQSMTYQDVIGATGGWMATAMFFLFALASVTPSCFCAFIAGNSFSTMIPGVRRMSSTMLGVTLAIILAFTGVAANLVTFFSIVGASFGPICGAIAADYLLSGRKWAGPRQGVNWAGYISWALGFLVGIIPFLPLSMEFKRYAQPAVVYSFVVGFIAYWIMAKCGLQPPITGTEGPGSSSTSANPPVGARA